MPAAVRDRTPTGLRDPGVTTPGSAVARQPVPAGAARMQTWHIDRDGRRVRTDRPVPVDGDDQPTAHVLHRCGKVRSVGGGGVVRCSHDEWLLPGAVRYCPDHGGEPLRPVQVAARPLDWVRELRRLYGAAAVPWAVLAAEVAAGVTARTADIPDLALLAAPVLAGGGYVVAKRTLTARAVRRRRVEKGQKTGRRVAQIARTSRKVAVAGAATGVWAASAAVADPGTWVGRATWIGMLAAWATSSYPWWLTAERRRLRGVEPSKVEVPAVVVEPPDPVALRAETTWKTRIGHAAGPLAGTHLETFRRLPGGPDGVNPARVRLPNWTAKVVADDPGSINMREDRPYLLGRIAAAYGCTYGDVSFAADETDLSIAYVRVQPDNVLAEARTWPGPQRANNWQTGRSVVGRFDDGKPIPYRWWSDTGAVHDLISGCTGSGKSEVVCQLLLDSLHSSGLVLDWVGDPQGGQSYGAIKGAVDWFARDKTEITFMLLAAVKEMYRRNDALSEANVKTWSPSRAMPLLVVTLDEVQSYINDPVVAELVTRLVGQGRKCGIKMRLVTQIPAAYALGDSTYIKEQLKAGQSFVFRSADDVAARSAVDGDCPIDPTMLPKKWGGATCAPDRTTAGLMFVLGVEGRDVYGRSDWTGEDMSVWLTDLSPAVFGADARAESGVLWGDRKARIAKALAAGRDDADLLPGGKALELIEAAAVSAAVAHPAPAGQVPEVAAGRQVRDVVLAAAVACADGNGVVTKDRIRAATQQVKDGSRDRALTDLVADGVLRRVKNGVYVTAV